MKRIKGGDRRDGWYEISPMDAQDLLAGRNTKNRPLSEHAARAYAEEMRQGRWLKNGEPLIFDAQGRLLDGQTRLRACIIADRMLESYCIFGIAPACFDTIDTGRARSPSDVAAIQGMKNYTTCATVARLAIQANRSKSGIPGSNQKVWNWAVDDWLRKNREEVEHVGSTMARYKNHLKGVIGPGTLGWIYLEARRQDPERAEQFLDGFATGANLGAGSPILALRRRLVEALQGTEQISPSARLLYLVKAWTAFRDGLRLQKLQIKEPGRVAMKRSQQATI